MDTESRSCVARLLDIRYFVLAARNSMRHAEPASALFMLFVFGLIALLLAPVYITFDLNSTWTFTTGLRTAAEPAISQMSAQTESLLQLSVGALLSGIILTSFTLLPSLFELAFPTVAHPLLSLILWLSIIFDYITDWQKSWDLVGTWVDNPTVRFLITVPLCAFFSIFVQALLVISITVVIFAVITLVSGGKRQAEAVIIRQ
ncbi:hypothetical protein K2Z83_04575 [Oscillochloris sp. ZM17-4]|uniref:hypothetical protein n=1 Tax=Oscillochloris sp. ZM17-4 TaxID=2866714 RepID=UPI001C73B7A9|nr:hypothetical protein [Oscillochloris sp. ZM17-4]MBX0326956.1 hypothetical protein [Oscillochloris sp. ZM17-4]